MNKIVERNEHGDIKWIINDEVFATFINGRKPLYSKIERGEFVGYTIILRNEMGTTWIDLESKEEALETINNHIEKYDQIKERSESIAKYLTSDEGAWGRQDSFLSLIHISEPTRPY